MGIRMGKGELKWLNGDVYRGDFKDDICEGQATYTCSQSAAKYEGDWKALLRHGKGTLTCSRFTYSVRSSLSPRRPRANPLNSRRAG